MAPHQTTLAAGDCMVSPEAYPRIDSIVAGNQKRQLQVEHLAATLKFLELAVIYERLIVPYVPPQPIEVSQLKVKVGDIVTIQCIETPRLQIGDDIKRMLSDAGCLVFRAVAARSARWRVFTLRLCRRLRKALEGCAVRLSTVCSFIQRTARRSGGPLNLDPERAALTDIATILGVPYTLSEYCAYLDIPLYISDRETTALQTAEVADSRLRRGVIDFVCGRFADAARAEVRKLTLLGSRTIFPETPIASQILTHASSPGDISRVALQLRREFASFRTAMLEIENDLRSESVSLKTKRKRYQTLVALANEVWPETERAYFKEAWEVSDFLTGVAAVAGSPAVSVGELLKILKSVPKDTFKQWFARRKVRILMRSRKQFLASRDHVEHVARVFNLPKRHVRDVLRTGPAA